MMFCRAVRSRGGIQFAHMSVTFGVLFKCRSLSASLRTLFKQKIGSLLQPSLSYKKSTHLRYLGNSSLRVQGGFEPPDPLSSYGPASMHQRSVVNISGDLGGEATVAA